ncbi:MAG: NDP-sugar synthase [Thermoanaerobaculia bacterium]
MAPLRLRALVLAAGRGERLRPLTAEIPKPLLPVACRPLIAWTLERLRVAGCEAVAINLHHLGQKIRDVFGASFRGMPIHYSEEPELLGTAGALPPLVDFFAAAELALVVNGDSLCRWPVEALVAAHRRKNRPQPVATLLVQRKIDPREFGGGVALENDDIVAFRKGQIAHEAARRHLVFAGAQVFEPAVVQRLRPGPNDLVSALYEPLLAEGARIAAVATERLWHDLGTPQRYLEGVLDFAFRGSHQAFRVVKGATVDATAKLRRSIVEPGARIGAAARLRSCIVMRGAVIGEGARMERCLVGPGVEVENGFEAHDLLLTQAPAGDGSTTTRIER